jgi:hypothetical protein
MADVEPQVIRTRNPKYEKAMYFRRPRDWENHPGWIVTAGTNAGRVESYMWRGFEPLHKYGHIEGSEAGGNPWQQILEHPDGPAEFPAEQVMVLRWYKEKDCPVPGVKFPQLQGHKIVEYKCPECKREPFAAIDGEGGVEPLAFHLRVRHAWDRASLVRYGEKVGIDFDAIYSHVQETIEFELGEKETGEHDCPECDWKPKDSAKRPDVALRFHQKAEHSPLEVEAVG